MLIKQITRPEKEVRLRQRAGVIWLFGLSGAGKTTLGDALEHLLVEAGLTTMRLDGDQLRRGLNQGLGFSDTDRAEALRRAAETAKLSVAAGFVTICSFITPQRAHRELVRKIIGPADLIDVYIEASYAVCAGRDGKGLYKQAARGELQQFTGKDSIFEPPLSRTGCFIINTEREAVDVSAARLRDLVLPIFRQLT